MLMEIDPLPMRGSFVMMMVMIYPSRRDVSPAEQLRRSHRLVSPGSASRRRRFVPKASFLFFFQGERLHIAKDGHRRPARGPTRQGARPGGQGVPPTLVGRLWPPSGTSCAHYFLYILKVTSVKFQDFWSCAEQVSNICSFSSPESQLPAFSLFMINLVK